ncbi:MAG: glycoside hydrolase family 3 N-terminal domain-containing protein [Micromonosporaceae bacterium]
MPPPSSGRASQRRSRSGLHSTDGSRWGPGAALATEYVRAGYNNILGPDADIVRTWHFGRTAEELGEDPYLTGALIAPEVAAIQSEHVLATVKHFVAYNRDQARSGDGVALFGPSLPGNHGVNETISDRAQRMNWTPRRSTGRRKTSGRVTLRAWPRGRAGRISPPTSSTILSTCPPTLRQLARRLSVNSPADWTPPAERSTAGGEN